MSGANQPQPPAPPAQSSSEKPAEEKK